MITKFKIFEEYRISDNVTIIGSGLTYNTNDDLSDKDFIKYKTFNIKI